MLNIKQLTLNAKAINLKAKTFLNLKNQQLNSQIELKISHFKTKDIKLNKVKVVANIKSIYEVAKCQFLSLNAVPAKKDSKLWLGRVAK